MPHWSIFRVLLVSLFGMAACIVVTPPSVSERTGKEGYSDKADYQVPVYGHPSYSLSGDDYRGYLTNYHGHQEHLQPAYHFQPAQMYHHHQNDQLKHLLLPLAGVALLGAAAIFAANPVLLQLGVVSSVGKRRKRSMSESEGIAAVEEYISQYRSKYYED